MPITTKGFARSSLLLIIVGLVALIGIVGTTIWLVERTQTYFEVVVDAREARRAAVDLRNLLQDVQTGQRGFLLTLDDEYLEPYNDALGQIRPAFNRLRELLLVSAQLNMPLDDFETTLQTKLAELDQTISLAQEGEIGQAVAIVRTDEGKRMMDEMRDTLDMVIEAADNKSFEGVVDQRATANVLRLVSVVGALIIIGVVGSAVLVVVRYTRDLDTARESVHVLNQDLEFRVAERTQDLIRANEEVQRFAYIVTHDLRAPLVNIMGFTSELEASLPSIRALVESQTENPDDPVLTEAKLVANEDLPEAIEFIRSSTRKMDGLINAILKISREGQRKLQAERLDLEEVVETAAASIQHQLDENGGTISISIKTPPIFSDRLALEQILGNLLDNAIKYRHPDRDLAITIAGMQESSGRIVIDVADNGRGISGDDHDRVFELFRRSGNHDKPGEGIGLAHVRIMARNLGGEITLDSTLGEGTVFHVALAPDLRTIVRKKQ